DDEWLEGYLERVELRLYTARTIVDAGTLREELLRVRRQGWALVDEEFEEGLRALAAPIRDGDGRVVAAVNVSMHTSRWRIDAIRASLLPRLLELATAVGAELPPPQTAPRRERVVAPAAAQAEAVDRRRRGT